LKRANSKKEKKMDTVALFQRKMERLKLDSFKKINLWANIVFMLQMVLLISQRVSMKVMESANQKFKLQIICKKSPKPL